MEETRTDAEVEQLLRAIDEAYDTPAWHGPNLRGSIRRVNADLAAWRPEPTQTNIHEIVLHAAYWKYVVLRGLRGDERGGFPRRGSNWFVRPTPVLTAGARAREWKEDVTLLDTMHRELRASIATIRSLDLQRMLTPQLPAETLIRGIAAHDVYHAGQIQTLKHLFKAASAKSPATK